MGGICGANQQPRFYNPPTGAGYPADATPHFSKPGSMVRGSNGYNNNSSMRGGGHVTNRSFNAQHHPSPVPARVPAHRIVALLIIQTPLVQPCHLYSTVDFQSSPKHLLGQPQQPRSAGSAAMIPDRLRRLAPSRFLLTSPRGTLLTPLSVTTREFLTMIP